MSPPGVGFSIDPRNRSGPIGLVLPAMIFWFASVGWAHDGTLTTNYEKPPNLKFMVETEKPTFQRNEEINLTITVENVPQEIPPPPELPEIDGLDPIRGSSQSWVTNFDGGYVQSKSFTVTYVSLRSGTFRIPALAYKILGHVLTSAPFQIRVTDTVSAGVSEDERVEGSRLIADEKIPVEVLTDDAVFQRNSLSLTGRDMFLYLRVDKDPVFVNEEVRLTLYFGRLAKFWVEPYITVPPFVGFFSENVPIPDPLRERIRKIDGRRYFLSTWMWALYPLRPGMHRIDPFEVKFTLDPAEDPVSFRSNPVEFRVFPLPAEGKPDNFSGLVGRFSAEASSTFLQTSVGEPVPLQVRIRGIGNLRAVYSLALPDRNGLEIYQVGSLEDPQPPLDQESGKKEFQYFLVPHSPIDFPLNDFSVPYFDPEARQYRVLKPEPIWIKAVGEEPVPPSGLTGRHPAQKPIAKPRREIQFIKPDEEFLDSQEPTPREVLWYAAILVGIPVLYAAFSVGWGHYKAFLRDGKPARRKRAMKSIENHLAEARRRLDREEQREFYISLNHAMSEFFILHFGFIPDQPGEPSVTRFGSSREGDLYFRMKLLFDQCEIGRFAKTESPRGDMEELFRKTGGLISLSGQSHEKESQPV